MANFTYKTILKRAKTCKTNVEKNGEIGINRKWLYYFCKAVQEPGKSINKFSFKDCTNPTGSKISKKITKKDYLSLAKKLTNHVEKNKKLSNSITYDSYRISPDLMVYAMARVLIWYDNHKNVYPNYCNFDSSKIKKFYSKSTTTTTTSKSSSSSSSAKKTNTTLFISKPHYTGSGCDKLGQCTSYWCGPHSIHQALKKFGITNISESTLAKWAGTTTAGTDHQGLNTAIAQASKKSGVKLSVEWKNFSDFGSSTDERFKAIGKLLANSNKAIFFHIGYQCSGSCVTGTSYGHYEMLDRINTSTKYVRALNSLGSKCGSSAYCGHLQDRTYNVQAHFISNISQKSVCIITKG